MTEAATLTFPDFQELAFDPEKHIYRLAGKYIPAVSTILKPLSSAFYKGIDEEVLNAAAARGTSIHESIENFIKYDITDASEEAKTYVDAFVSWWRNFKPLPLKAECRVYHPTFRYAGTSDLLCDVGGKLTVIDYKSTTTISEMLVRPQLEAYAKALKAHKIPVEEKAVLHLQRDGGYQYIPFKPVDAEAWEVFGALLTAYNYQQKYIA
jgi:acetyl esterase/lipase